MRKTIPTDSQESNFDQEFSIIPAGEYSVTTNVVFAGETSKGTPRISIPFTVTGGIYPLDVGGLLDGQRLINSKRVVGPSEYTGKRFWFNLYLRNYYTLAHIIDANASNLNGGQRKNASIIQTELTTLGLPSANDPDDPFAYMSYPMTETAASELIATYLTEKYTNEPPMFHVRTVIGTYGDDNIQTVNVKSIRRYKEMPIAALPKKGGSTYNDAHYTGIPF